MQTSSKFALVIVLIFWKICFLWKSEAVFPFVILYWFSYRGLHSTTRVTWNFLRFWSALCFLFKGHNFWIDPLTGWWLCTSKYSSSSEFVGSNCRSTCHPKCERFNIFLTLTVFWLALTFWAHIFKTEFEPKESTSWASTFFLWLPV